MQAKDIPTIATRPATIPQYPHDIGHTLARVARVPQTLCRHMVDPPRSLVFYSRERFLFPAQGG